MFFSAELLSRRDNGFGLLWLAATLGSKSAFKKLPRRSVMTADIAQLCDLIAEPAEPLALRLSSNLMVGVARVYKVKQEILFSDVSNCVASLKKVVLDIQSAAQGDTRHQMAHPTVRATAVTIAHGSTAGYELDAFAADWDAFLTHEEQPLGEGEADDDYDPKHAHVKKAGKNKANEPQEDVRANACTLKEHHDHLLSNSFDLSFSASQIPLGGGQDTSSSQAEGFLNDPFFSDGLDLGGDMGDELARELGEGWGAPPSLPAAPLEFNDVPMDIDMDFNFGAQDLNGGWPGSVPPTPQTQAGQRKRKAISDQKENQAPSSIGVNGSPAMTPARTFTQELMSQDMEAAANPLADITEQHNRPRPAQPKKKKKTRLLLDARTELTDEELKTARAQYLLGQKILRDEMDQKCIERNNGRLIEEIIWGVPQCIQNPLLGDFWQENFKVQVESRTGALHIHIDAQLPRKRRKTKHADEAQDENVDPFGPPDGAFDFNMDADMGMGMQEDPFIDGPMGYDAGPHPRSSEEPGQGRQQHSRQSSLTRGQFGLDIEKDLSQSQRSSLFPWDNAGFLSSSSGIELAGDGPDRVSIDRADVRLRGNSVSHRDSSLIPSHAGSGGVPMSPGGFERGSQLGEDYHFEVDALEENSRLESQKSDMNLITLERNSFNFLEYAKMQMQTLPDPTEGLSFDTIVPKQTSTRHVASAAFYHCLVLATKDLVHLKQPQPYGPITLLLAIHE